MLCRNWAQVADMLGVGGPREPMAGPYAALLGLVACGAPMVVWSLLVDRVHRRASTGLDWNAPRGWGEGLGTGAVKLVGLWATWALIGAAYVLERYYWQGSYLFAIRLMGAALVPLVLLSIPYVLWLERVLVERRDGAWHMGAMLLGRAGWDGARVAHHARVWAVKGFFTAFMLSILPGGFFDLVRWQWDGRGGAGQWADHGPVRGGCADRDAGLSADAAPARRAYPQRQSLPRRLAGGVDLLSALHADGGGQCAGLSSGDGGLDLLDGGASGVDDGLGGLAGGAGGDLCLGDDGLWLEVFNLTYRGVLTGGPYRLTRHPAYVSKNLFWWSSTLPFFATTHLWSDMVRNTVLMAGVSAVYWWRGCTEARHLAAEDPKYRAYSRWARRHAPVTRALIWAERRLLG
jgi:hypothetical protein